MPHVSFAGLVVVAAIAVVAPLLVGLFPKIRVPSVVLMIVAGIAVGPHGFKLIEHIDVPIQVLSLVGLAFLLFLAGLEIDVHRLRGPVLRLALMGFVLTLALGLVAGGVFKAAGTVKSPLFLAIALAATSLGLVVPVLKDAGKATGELGQLTIAASSVADFGAVILLTLFFSGEGSTGTGAKLVLLGGFVLLVGVAWFVLTRLEGSMRYGDVLVRLQDTTAEIRVRIAVLLLIGFVALAERLGLETILGAFIAGALLNLVDTDTSTHPHFRLKLEAIGYGFVVPVFFVASGLRFDLDALLASPSAFARVPLFLVALLVVRGTPALLYRRTVGTKGAVAAGLLQATSLPFIVTATEIGLLLHLLTPVNGAALVSAGLLSVVVFPLVALGILRGDGTAEDSDAEPTAAMLPGAEAAAGKPM
ncbi:MAG: Na+/H+ antiporter-like protein [Acidimicrobiales bacterium]|nr:Na+/H+ antiporter-like protein [Acidimicrobiales bacterium]